MSDEPKRSRWWKRAWLPWALILLLLIAYPLSIGPFSWWTQDDPHRHEIYGGVYAPLWCLYENCPESSGGAMDWYIAKWTD